MNIYYYLFNNRIRKYYFIYSIIELKNIISIFFVLIFFATKRTKYEEKIRYMRILLKYAENLKISKICKNRIFAYF